MRVDLEGIVDTQSRTPPPPTRPQQSPRRPSTHRAGSPRSERSRAYELTCRWYRCSSTTSCQKPRGGRAARKCSKSNVSTGSGRARRSPSARRRCIRARDPQRCGQSRPRGAAAPATDSRRHVRCQPPLGETSGQRDRRPWSAAADRPPRSPARGRAGPSRARSREPRRGNRLGPGGWPRRQAGPCPRRPSAGLDQLVQIPLGCSPEILGPVTSTNVTRTTRAALSPRPLLNKPGDRRRE
jgi:hypothetical protein